VSAVLVSLLSVGAVAIVVRTCVEEPPPAPPTTSASAQPVEAPRARCLEKTEPFVVGKESPIAEDDDPLMTPFAVVVGRAVRVGESFAVATMMEGEGGSVAQVVRIGATGVGSVAKLARLRGDLDPPALAATGAGDEVLAAWLEPNASSRAVRLAKLNGDSVTKGAEIPEGRDESLAVDIASTDGRGVVVWDVTEEDGSAVLLAGFGTSDLSSISHSRRVTPKKVDADSPRIVAHSGGYFLAYLVHGGETRRETVTRRGAAGPLAPDDDSKRPRKKPKQDPETDEADEELGGEAIHTVWVEVMPLDKTGAQTSDPIRVSPTASTVAAFDVGLAPDGALVVAYRDDDSPTGGVAGGPLEIARVTLGGSIERHRASDEPVEGVPGVLDGWFALATLKGPDVLAKMGPTGLPVEALAVEPSLERGEPIAAAGDRLLLAEPRGRAMRFYTTRCEASGPPPAPPTPSASAGPDDD
jgi:hypothetical protein